MSYAADCRTLGVQPGATHEEVRAAYRRKMLEVHPDRGGTDDAAAAVTKARDRLMALPSGGPRTTRDPVAQGVTMLAWLGAELLQQQFAAGRLARATGLPMRQNPPPEWARGWNYENEKRKRGEG